ncbi:MAG: hypothetical protein WDM92_15755 [Caulobacteraceae bacterium]
MSRTVQPNPSPRPLSGRAARLAQAQQAAAGEADLRLFIEDAAEPGRFVYTTVDRRTGEVVSRVPREDVERTIPAWPTEVNPPLTMIADPAG